MASDEAIELGQKPQGPAIEQHTNDIIQKPSNEKSRDDVFDSREESICGALPPPATAAPIQQRWNSPKINMWRCFATFYTFIVMGLNDSAYGALIPYLETYYNVNYTVVSLVFLSPMGGYITSALLLSTIHMHFGQRGIAIAGSLAHLISYVVVCLHPPYPVLVVFFIVAGYGNGAFDGAWNAWIGDMANCNEVLGFLHAFYGVGGVLAPLLSSAAVTKWGWQWYEFYYIMVGASAVEVVILVSIFWTATAEVHRNQHPHIIEDDTPRSNSSSTNTAIEPSSLATTTEKPRRKKYLFFGPRLSPNRTKAPTFSNHRTLAALQSKVTWLASLFLLIYVGVEVATGGWTVTFMLRVRHGAAFASGLTSTGFWLGVTVGRVTLGFATARLFRTEKHAIATYLVITISLVLLYWLVPVFAVSALAVSLIGFFIGPMFPAAVVVATKLLPKHLHVGAIGFAAAFGASGACALPFAVGAIAQAKGVWVLMPIVLVMLVTDLGVWIWIPKLPKVRQA